VDSYLQNHGVCAVIVTTSPSNHNPIGFVLFCQKRYVIVAVYLFRFAIERLTVVAIKYRHVRAEGTINRKFDAISSSSVFVPVKSLVPGELSTAITGYVGFLLSGGKLG
jgi:hypothetical protein